MELSLNWANSRHSVRDIVRARTDLEYINTTPSSVVVNGMQVAHQVQGVQGVSSRYESLKPDESLKKGVIPITQAQTPTI